MLVFLILCASAILAAPPDVPSRVPLLHFVPENDQDTLFIPLESPSIGRDSAIEKALSNGALGATRDAIDQVVLVRLYDRTVDPPYNDALAWAVNFDPGRMNKQVGGPAGHATYPVLFAYVLIDARSGDLLFSAEGGGQPTSNW